MISKGSYSGFRHSPYASPFLAKNLATGFQAKPDSEHPTHNTGLSNSMFSLSLLSPAQHDNGTPN